MFEVSEENQKNELHFLHIGKTGGSAIQYAFREYLETPQYNIHLRAHGVTLRHIPKGEHLVFFLRDPISRFVSGFYSRQRKGQPRYYFEWSLNEEEAFNAFETPDKLACALSDESSLHFSLAVKAMKHIQHLRHYRYWYGSIEYFKSRLDDILFVGFQESLDEDFDKLKQILGIPSSITLPEDDIRAHRSPEHVDKSLVESGITALKEWYKADIEFVAICRELMSNK